jgi:uncharacterized protein (DUF1697 family)
MPKTQRARYAALLRGVSPMNASMPKLARAFELAGFENVKTVLASGNVLFDAPVATDAVLARKCEAAMTKHLDRSFMAIVRSVDHLRELLASSPYADAELDPSAKQVVTFLASEPARSIALPVMAASTTLVRRVGLEVFGAYVDPDGPAMMRLIEKTFGKEVTTRTLGTVAKLAK